VTTRALRNLLFAANVLGVIAVLSTAIGAISSNATLEPVYEEVSSKTAVPLRQMERQPPPLGNYTSCWKPDIKKPEAAGPQTAQTSEPQPIAGQFKLFSTFFVPTDGKKQGYAAIAHNNAEAIYREQDKIGEYMLAEVFPDKVILEKGGQKFTLERIATHALPPTRTASRTPVDPRSPAADRKRAKRPSVTSDLDSREEIRGGSSLPANSASSSSSDTNPLSPKRIAVSSKDKKYVTENFAKILHDVNLQTELSPDDGTMTGVKIDRVKTDSILYRVGGLRAGDIVRKVDGQPISSVAAAMSLYEQYTKNDVKRVNVEIERDGRIISNNYSINDLQK
jgi:type II secretory pathway component PulC